MCSSDLGRVGGVLDAALDDAGGALGAQARECDHEAGEEAAEGLLGVHHGKEAGKGRGGDERG